MNDEPSNSGRRYFTLRELLVVVTIIALGFAVLVPTIRSVRHEQQRTECTNHLKQIGLGLLNFHDMRQEICPSYITDDHSPRAIPNGFASWPILFGWALESKNYYDLVDYVIPMDQSAPPPADHAMVRCWTIRTFVCPARGRDIGVSPDSFGAGDYASVSLAEAVDTVVRSEPRTWDAAMLPSRTFNASTGPSTIELSGFKPGTLGGREYRSLTSNASIRDGLSYTVFIGEKGVRADRLGRDAQYLVDAALPSHQDGTFYYGRGGNPADLKAPGDMAFWSRSLAPAKPGERLLPAKALLENPDNRFGGWHEGVTLFLMGDGSVLALSNDTSALVLQRLGSRNDGQNVELPGQSE